MIDQVGRIQKMLKEQPIVGLDIDAVDGEEHDIINLPLRSPRVYILRSLRLTCEDPGVNTVTVRLYEQVNNILQEVDSFEITTVNYGTFFSLMDMFGLPYITGNEIQITVRASVGTYGCLAQYEYAQTD